VRSPLGGVDRPPNWKWKWKWSGSCQCILIKSSTFCALLCSQGVHLDDCAAAPTHCECSDTDPVCPRCGGTRQLRKPVGVASVGVASAGEHVLQASPTSVGDKDVFETPPTSATVPDDGADKDEARCLQRLHSASEITVAYHYQHQQRSFSTTVTESFSILPDPSADVGGVSVRSAPDSAFSVRQPEVSGQGGQRSKFQRFFEPLKRSKSAGVTSQKDAISVAQASLYDPTRQQITVEI